MPDLLSKIGYADKIRRIVLYKWGHIVHLLQ